MLLLHFQAGNDRYGLDVSRVVAVIPQVILRPLPHADAAVAGIFNYHETMVPVIDLTVLLAGDASRPLFSTRIILVDYPVRPDQLEKTGGKGGQHILGLLAQQVTETIFCAEAELQPAGIAVEGAPYLGGFLMHPEGMIQRVLLERLLPPLLHDSLFPPLREA